MFLFLFFSCILHFYDQHNIVISTRKEKKEKELGTKGDKKKKQKFEINNKMCNNSYTIFVLLFNVIKYEIWSLLLLLLVIILSYTIFFLCFCSVPFLPLLPLFLRLRFTFSLSHSIIVFLEVLFFFY